MTKALDSRPFHILVRGLFALVLAASLVLSPRSALADVLGSDCIGSRTIDERGLTVADSPDVDAECALLIDSDGNVLWSRSPGQSHAIASITKVMTAVVALENMSLDETITISENAASIGESSANLVAGSELSLETLLHGMLVESGNDAAVAIAEGVGGNEATFVQMMNDKAATLNMASTHYVDANGLSDDTFSCASDLATLMRYAMRNEAFRNIVCIAQEDIDLGSGTVSIENTNELLSSYEGCIGIKTGTTDLAGNCLAAAASRDGLELYSIVLGSSGYYTRFDTTEELLDWGYTHYVPVSLGMENGVVAKAAHTQWMDKTVPLVCESIPSVYLLDIDGAVHQEISLTEISGDVSKGDVLGSITWTQGDKVVGTSRLIASQDCAAPGFFQRIGIWFKRTFTDADDTAQTEILAPDIEISSAL